MFKNWEHCKLICFHLGERMKEPYIKELNRRIGFAESLEEVDRRYFIFDHIRIACLDSGIWDYQGSFRTWLEKEIKEIDKMIEYYEANKDARTV
tara:strand:+ start:227 stop:508 length:282 start_codon:yes stop_codon:yes gene_type:complete